MLLELPGSGPARKRGHTLRDPVRLPFNLKLRWRRLAGWLGGAAGLLLLLAFPWGPLFPLSPVKPGYHVHRFRRADLVAPKDRTPHPSYLELDRLLEEAEKFHQLPGPKRLTVVVCRDWGDFYRFMPHFYGWKGLGMALHPLNTVYLTPRIQELGFDEEEALRHELAHTVHNRNCSFRAALEIKRQQWVGEGLAVWFQGGRRFLSAAEFLERARHRDLLRIIPPAGGLTASPESLPFRYAAWHYFLRYLVERYGRDSFQRFLLAYLNDPAPYREHFAKVYGRPLADVVADFQGVVRQGRLSTPPETSSAIRPPRARPTTGMN